MKIVVFLLLLLFLGSGYNNRYEINEGLSKNSSLRVQSEITGEEFLNCSFGAECQSAGLSLLINNTLYDPDDAEFLLTPGKVNQLVVKADESILQNKNPRVIVSRVLPDGRRIAESMQFNGQARGVQFDLGPMSAAPEYEYGAGEVFIRGYQLLIHIEDEKGEYIGGWEFEQGLSKEVTPGRTGMAGGGTAHVDLSLKLIRMEVLHEGRQMFDPKFGSLPLFLLRLGSEVLSNQDNIRILAGLNDGETSHGIDAVLRITNPAGKEVWRKQIHLKQGAPWNSYPVEASEWPTGDYQVEILPVLDGRIWPDGSAVTYRRRETDPEAVPVSPLANWMLQRDKEREEIRIDDFRSAHKQWGIGQVNEKDWGWETVSPGKVSLASRGDYDIDPVVFSLPANGYYAVFANIKEVGYLIQVGTKGLIRAVPPTELNNEEVFIAASDLTNDVIRIYSGSDPQKWSDGDSEIWDLKGSRGSLISLRLVPVTASSVESFYLEMLNPPIPMAGVNDWAEYFGPPWSRLSPDQFESIVCGQAEIGWRTLGWSIGRSWVEYHSKLPQTDRFPTIDYEEARMLTDPNSHNYKFMWYDYGRRVKMINEYDPLEEVYISRKNCRAQIWPWLGMNRHYGVTAHGGMFSSQWFKENRQWWHWGKNASSPRGSAVSYFFPEVRKERLDILLEVAERGADGLVIGCDRQVPMLLYNPTMVKAYKDKTGVDPLKIDISDGEIYIDWIRWRADFFTQMIRELKSALQDLALSDGNPNPLKVSVRIASSGLLFNLAQGMDIEQWFKEGLVDRLLLNPLEDLGGKGQHNVRPYLELGRQYGVEIYGGIGATGWVGWSRDANERDGSDIKRLIPGLKRALSLLKEGVDGIDSYETEYMSFADPIRFLVAMYGNQQRIEAFLSNSNLEAVAPVDAGSAMAGFDNHSRWHGGWTMEGFGGNSL